MRLGTLLHDLRTNVDTAAALVEAEAEIARLRALAYPPAPDGQDTSGGMPVHSYRELYQEADKEARRLRGEHDNLLEQLDEQFRALARIDDLDALILQILACKSISGVRQVYQQWRAAGHEPVGSIEGLGDLPPGG